MKSSRRSFLIRTAGFASLLVGSTVATAAEAPKLTEADPMAAALGYKSDASKVDKAKYPSFASGSACAGCSLYQGKAGASSGPCQIFSGKEVSAKGWCSSFSKKS